MSLFDDGVEPVAQPGSVGARVGVAEVTHASVRDQLSDYLDDSLPRRERERVADHLGVCQACRSYAATLRATIDAATNLPREPAPEAARERLRRIAEG